MTANQDLFDAALRHQVAVRRYSATLLKRMVKLLEEADRDLVEHLRAKLARAVGATDSTARLEALIVEVRAMRKAIGEAVEDAARGELVDFAALEAEWEQSIMTTALPVELVLAAPQLDTLRAIVESEPFQGRFLADWFSSQRTADQEKLEQVLRMGMANGETLDDMVRRVVGTRANKYADGILAINRRNAEAVIRTAVTHVSVAARGAVWAANEDIIWALRWTATLDGRTSPICQSRDGDLAMVGENRLPAGSQALSPKDARPPAHINCRSTMVAVFSPEGILGDRPFVRDVRTRPARDVDFRADAKAKAGDAWKGMTEAERRAATGRVRDAWGRENVGTVPSSTTYAEWMGRQPRAFQDEVLGPTRAELFRSGRVTLDQFVDHSGKSLTLAQLRKFESPELPKVFKTAPSNGGFGDMTFERFVMGFIENPVPYREVNVLDAVGKKRFTKKWDDAFRDEVLDVSTLTTYQSTLDKVPAVVGDWNSLPPIKVARINGINTIMDGNHRAAALFAQGAKSIKAIVIDLDDPKNASLVNWAKM